MRGAERCSDLLPAVLLQDTFTPETRSSGGETSDTWHKVPCYCTVRLRLTTGEGQGVESVPQSGVAASSFCAGLTAARAPEVSVKAVVDTDLHCDISSPWLPLPPCGG
ncbi:hypothetical protein GN956_G7471 [Arapaima gigas]